MKRAAIAGFFVGALLGVACAHIPDAGRAMEPPERRVVLLLREAYDADPAMPRRRARCRDRELVLVVLPLEEVERVCLLAPQWGTFRNVACLGQAGSAQREALYLSEGHARPLETIAHEAAHDALRCAQVGADPGHTFAPLWGPGGVVRRVQARL